MRGFLLLVLAAGCSAQRMTHSRQGWGSCRAADPNAIECGGRQMALVECYLPGDEACGALAVRYADGERVFLFRPAGFEPGREETLTPGAVLRPELASDGTMIWYKPAQPRTEQWTVYEPESGLTRKVDAFKIFQMRERDPHSMPLWVASPPPAPK